MKYVALIPARGGSKSIPRKNIRPLAGKPLLYWTCKAASDVPAIESVYVATDDEEIAGVVRDLGLPRVTPIGRGPETATDSASTESVLLDFARRVDFENLILIQATSPLLRSSDLQRAIELFESGSCDSVLSVVRQKRFLWSGKPGALVAPVNYDPARRPRRQDFDGFLVENGAFYLTAHARLLATGCRLSGRTAAVEMDEQSYLELDEPEDWLLVEQLLRHRLRKAGGDLAAKLRRIRFVASDVDGVLTDSGMYYSESGDELKKFNTRDGKGFELLREAGLLTGLITAENVELVARRARKLRLDEVHRGAADKVAVMAEILQRRNLSWEQVAFLGDDLGDVELLRRVGVSACPCDAVGEVLETAGLRLESRGGAGVVREFAELLLNARRRAAPLAE